MKVVVVGAGKMGLPLACQFANNGARVIACDIKTSIVDAINRGVCPINEPGVPDLLTREIQRGALKATTDIPAAVAESDVVVVIVPALLGAGKKADISSVETASTQIAKGLKVGMLVSVETTLPVGGTRRLLPILEKSGLKAGEDFDLVYSPERLKSQLILERLTQIPKVVGGITPEAASRAAAFYGDYLRAPVLNVGSLETAEMVKLAGMIYRDANIALMNELARYAEAVGIDLHTVIKAANTDGEAFLLRPGIGVGGHCTPVYPYFLIREGERVGIPMRIAEISRRINDEQPRYVLDRLERVWGPLRGRRVLILGLGFRPQVKEHAFSPAYRLSSELLRRGAQALLHDPLYTDEEIRSHGFTPGSLTSLPLPEVFVLNTAHAAYAELDFDRLAAQGLEVVVDGRALWLAETVRGAGLIYLGVGRPDGDRGSVKAKILPITRPLLASEEAEVAAEVIRSGWIAQGPQVAAFEREFAEYVGAKYACATSSCTAALHLALLAVGVQPGDEVITVSHSYIATANVVCYCGARPVFVDINPDTFNMDPTLIEDAITEHTRAILCVHQMGMPCDLVAVLDIARRHSLAVVEDAACALGSEILWNGKWEKIGKPHGDIACFSFHPRKIITTGDGGMMTTSSPEWDRGFRLRRQHGMNLSAAVRHSAREVVFESYPILGYNYRITDIQAAIGREQLKRLPDIIERRRCLASRYSKLLATIHRIRIPEEPPWARTNWQSYCVVLPPGTDQRQVMQFMLERGVATRQGIMCAHREEAYADGGNLWPLHESEKMQDQGIILPLYPEMSEGDQSYVVEVLREACAAV